MAAKSAKPSKSEGQKEIATNPNARRNYFIEETLEAGIVLQGTEIKSIRAQSPNLKDAYVSVNPKLEAFLFNVHIAPYTHGNQFNHEPLRPRKLLLHRREIEKVAVAIQRKGMTAVPTRMYFVKGRAKIEIGLAKGKKAHDKRQDQKERSAKREMDQARKRDRE